MAARYVLFVRIALRRNRERAPLRNGPASCVLLSHPPRGIHEADTLGVDLQVSGHSQGGRLFPWGLLVRLEQPWSRASTNSRARTSREPRHGAQRAPARVGAL